MSNSATRWTVCILRAPLSMEFSRQEYWSDLPFPSLGDLPDPRVSCIAGRFPNMSHQGSPYMIYIIYPQKFPKNNYVYVNTHMGLPNDSAIKNPPAKQETRFLFLGQEDPQRRKWQPTPVFWPWKSHGQRSLVGL